MGPKKSTKSTEVDTKKRSERRNWGDEEIEQALDYLLDTIKKGHVIEKPNARAYYEALLTSTKIDCTENQMKNQIYHLRQKFTKTIKWRDETGQGLLEFEGAESVRGE
jgi:hypothetical protein